MTVKRKTRKTAEERKDRVAALHQQLEEFVDGLDETAIAAITARWDGYSERNALLIAAQRPDATDVSGFRAWLARGRFVRKGESGIAIFAPAGTGAPTKDENGGEKPGKQRFRVAYVFDISQTGPVEE